MNVINGRVPNNSLVAPSFAITKPKTQTQTNEKKRVLFWSDACFASTGFGVVSAEIMNALHSTGLYTIDQLGINFFGTFYDKEKYPYTIVPSRLKSPSDPYGSQMFIDALQEQQYDLVFVINDTFVVEEVAKRIEEIRSDKRQLKHKLFKLVYYFPIDCRVMPYASTMIRVADQAVAYTEFAKNNIERANIETKNPVQVIYHGAKIDSYKPISKEERKRYRARYLGTKDDDTFVWMCANRNSVRKDIPRTIYAFNEFKKKVPNSKLYLHTVVKDGSGNGMVTDLIVPIKELNLKVPEDVIFPNQKQYNAAKGYPEHLLNQLYNMADGFITTDLGEGYGLTKCDAMSAGIPVVTGNHTSSPELFGKNGDRGYLYECKERAYIDNSGFRKFARMEDIVSSMMECYNDWISGRKDITFRARKFAEKYSWQNVGQEWIRLCAEVLSRDERQTEVICGEQL